MTRVSLKTVHRLEFSWDLLDSKSIVELYVSRFFSGTFQFSTVSAILASPLDSSRSPGSWVGVSGKFGTQNDNGLLNIEKRVLWQKSQFV